MFIRNMAVMLGGLALAGTLSGCGCFQGNEKIAQLECGQQQQQKELAALRQRLEETQAKLKTLSAGMEAPEDRRDKLMEAALFLAENAPDNAQSQAIYLLGNIGGQKAENALLRMLENSPRQSNAIYQALANMQSKKLRPLIIAKLEQLADGGSFNDFNSFINNINNNSSGGFFGKNDVPLLKKVLAAIPDNDYNNNRYIRNQLIGCILRIDSRAGVDAICESLAINTIPNRQRELIYQLSNYNIPTGINEWRRIIEALGPVSTANAEVYGALCSAMQRGADWRLTEIVLPWAEEMKNNRNYGNEYLNLLLALRDPAAAKTVAGFLNNRELSRNYSRGQVEYPGLVRNAEQYAPISDAEMEKLLASRNKVMERLNRISGKADETKK